MKIGVYVSAIAGQKGYEHNVSGHIQVPLESCNVLRKAGYDVHLITNEFGEGRSLPFCLDQEMPVHFVTDSRKRGGVLERKGQQKEGLSLTRLWQQVNEIKRICKEQQFDVLHLFGYNRIAHLAGGLRVLGLDTPTVVTILGAQFPEKFSLVTKRLWNKVDAIVTSTTYVKDRLEREGISTRQVRHGIIRSIAEEHDGSELKPKHRVLFWRDLTTKNGADVAMGAYENLAAKYPDVAFEFAVRKHWDPVKDIEERATSYPNIHVYHFPYKDGITLPKLLLESICVVMPIRHMSIDPQLVIAETLAMGIPVITTNQRSNPEFVLDGKTGFLTDLGDVEQTTASLDVLLEDKGRCAQMGAEAKNHIDATWNWDSYVQEIVDVYAQVKKLK
ncbi:MAG: glycosyltransferase family 4 protein [Phycisphaerales bacterium]|nr:glycosyltransferase family 4 protein [Phycisphaerales bacterium]